MAVVAKWNSKTWEVSAGKVAALENLSFAYEQKADNNTSTEDKKETNERGTLPFALNFSTTLHSGAGFTNIRQEIDSWEALVTKTGYFYLNGKQLGPKLQLRKVSVGNVTLDDIGRMRLATLSISFKEYSPATTSVPESTSALKVSAQTDSKSVLKPNNPQIGAASTQGIKVGSMVRPTGSKYYTGQTIPQWVKDRSHQVSQIKESQNRVLLGSPDGINSWVFLTEVTLV
jgi:hypothetical protein